MDDSDMSSIRPRKRVSQACVPCSRRKTKCDGGLPACGQCRQRGVQDCTYSVSKRNKRERRTTSSLQDTVSGPVQRGSPSIRSTPPNHDLENHNAAMSSRSQNHETYSNNLGNYSPAPIGIRTVPNRTAPTALPEIPRDISARLFKAYFDTIHPIWPLLYKPVYDMLDHQRLLDTIPQQLLYAIYSIAACVQPVDDLSNKRVPDRLLPPPSLLFQAALLALGNDHTGNGFHPLKFLKPSIEACQALTILALQQHGVAESESAALLCSLAAGMAIELRLHREVKSDSASIDNQVRSRLWWNIFVLEKMMACELARPVLLRAEETDTSYPSASESDEYQLLSLTTSSQSGPVSVKTHTISGFHTTVQLTKIMEKVLREIYSVAGRAIVRENLKAGEEARMRLWQELKDYHLMLDSSPLKLDMNSTAPAPPVTITNMVWMWCITILLHRPFIPHWVKSGASSCPLQLCVMAAKNICSILERYSNNLPMLSCDMIFPIFTSASTLSYSVEHAGGEDPEARRLIQLCVRWLAILGKSWKNAGIFQETLSKDLRQPLGNGNHQADSRNSRSYNYGEPGASWQSQTEAAYQAEASGKSLISADDWAFLENLGDPADEFYTIDVSFRELLHKQFDIERTS